VPVRFNGELLRVLVNATGGVEAFIDAWSDPEDEPDKATVSRWIKGQWPKNSKRLLRLSAVLDIDPFALLVIRDNSPLDAADQLLDIVQSRRSIPPAIDFLHPFFGRRKCWPPVLEDHCRSWCIHEFVHDATRCNYYEAIEIYSQETLIRLRPQIFHFAYRHPHNFGARWLQYGLVSRNGVGAALWHINGHTQKLLLRVITAPTPVMTWLGPGPAIFRVASLHPFEITIFDKKGDQTCLVFPG